MPRPLGILSIAATVLTVALLVPAAGAGASKVEFVHLTRTSPGHYVVEESCGYDGWQGCIVLYAPACEEPADYRHARWVVHEPAAGAPRDRLIFLGPPAGSQCEVEATFDVGYPADV